MDGSEAALRIMRSSALASPGVTIGPATGSATSRASGFRRVACPTHGRAQADLIKILKRTAGEARRTRSVRYRAERSYAAPRGSRVPLAAGRYLRRIGSPVCGLVIPFKRGRTPDWTGCEPVGMQSEPI